MKKVEGQVTQFSTGEKARVRVTFPEGTAIAKGDRCYICGEDPVGIVTYVAVDKALYKDNGVRTRVEFPPNARITEGAKVYLSQPAKEEPDPEEVPCAAAIGCLLRVGSEHYPARDIASISWTGKSGMYIKFRDGRVPQHLVVLKKRDVEAIMRAWETALRATPEETTA